MSLYWWACPSRSRNDYIFGFTGSRYQALNLILLELKIFNFYSLHQCDHKTKRKDNLKRHIDAVHGDVWYSCDQCDYKSKWKGHLKKHIDSVHGEVRYSCDQCDYKATQKSNLKRQDAVHGDVRYSCDQCDYK